MSVVEHPNSWFPEFTIESGNGKYDMVAKMVDSKKKCCDDCDYFQQFDEGYADGFCMKNISNELGGEFIINSDTLYCPYHKFKV